MEEGGIREGGIHVCISGHMTLKSIRCIEKCAINKVCNEWIIHSFSLATRVASEISVELSEQGKFQHDCLVKSHCGQK